MMQQVMMPQAMRAPASVPAMGSYPMTTMSAPRAQPMTSYGAQFPTYGAPVTQPVTSYRAPSTYGAPVTTLAAGAPQLQPTSYAPTIAGAGVSQMYQPALTVAAPTVSYSQAPAAQIYSPMPAAAVQTSFQAPSYSTIQSASPAYNVVEAMPAVTSYLQAPAVQAEPVVLEQVGDWLVCQDELGIFYHHAPTGQSVDQCPF
jgi:hypothetical protein